MKKEPKVRRTLFWRCGSECDCWRVARGLVEVIDAMHGGGEHGYAKDETVFTTRSEASYAMGNEHVGGQHARRSGSERAVGSSADLDGDESADDGR